MIYTIEDIKSGTQFKYKSGNIYEVTYIDGNKVYKKDITIQNTIACIVNNYLNLSNLLEELNRGMVIIVGDITNTINNNYQIF